MPTYVTISTLKCKLKKASAKCKFKKKTYLKNLKEVETIHGAHKLVNIKVMQYFGPFMPLSVR